MLGMFGNNFFLTFIYGYVLVCTVRVELYLEIWWTVFFYERFGLSTVTAVTACVMYCICMRKRLRRKVHDATYYWAVELNPFIKGTVSREYSLQTRLQLFRIFCLCLSFEFECNYLNYWAIIGVFFAFLLLEDSEKL